MIFNPDQMIVLQWEHFYVNATLLFTWLIMALLLFMSIGTTRYLIHGPGISRWQNLLEIIVEGIRKQIAEISQKQPDRYVPFIGTLFLFIVLSNLLAVVPGYWPPTASLSTTTALAICVFIAVPLNGIAECGLLTYLGQYFKPTFFMLPFNIIGELSRTLALAVRLYGNMMSGMVIAAILLGIAPFFFPILMQLLGLLTGIIQAYIFAVLAMVYMASASVAHEQTMPIDDPTKNQNRVSEKEEQHND